MILERAEYLDYSDVLIKPQRSTINSRNDVDILSTFTGVNSKRTIKSSGIIVANMDTTGTIEMATAVQEYEMLVALHKFYGFDALVTAFEGPLKNKNHFVSIGESELDLLKYRLLHQRLEYKPNLMIDVANGYRTDFLKFIEKVRKEFPTVLIGAGNVCSSDIILDYKRAGVDLVKVGIGPGGQCRTRETAGVGVPQFTVVEETSSTAMGIGLGIIADGGVNVYADFVKAIGAGANFVMAGSIFGGHDETNPIVEMKDGKSVCKIYGMSSHEAQKKYYGELKDYRASEGRVSYVPYKGKVKNTVTEILGSLRSAMTYTDARTIEQFQKQVVFIKVNNTINRQYEKHTIGS